MLIRHRTIWAAPAPIWLEARNAAHPAARATAISRPALLRFASDEFMDELAVILERDPSQLAYLRAVPESWRNPAPRVEPPKPLGNLNRRLRQERAALPAPHAPNGAAELARAQLAAAVPAQPCKLYHPAHQRFYLVAACLVCELPGMPDHMLENGERAAFVMRRLLPKAGITGAPHPVNWQADWEEYALVPHGRERAWRKITATDTASNEERLPLFPMSYIAADGRRRRLLAGLIPVARRDAYMAAALADDDDGSSPPSIDPRLAMLRNDFLQIYWSAQEILANAQRRVNMIPHQGSPPTNDQKKEMLKSAYDQILVASWYALLDLSSYLAVNLPYVRKAIGAPFPPEQPANVPPRDPNKQAAEDALLAQLQAVGVGPIKLDAALRIVDGRRTQLENTTQLYTSTNAENPPNFGVWPTMPNSNPPIALDFMLTDSGLAALFAGTGDGITLLESLVRNALPSTIPLRTAEPPPAAVPMLRAGDPAYFVVRCVHEQPNCNNPPTLSTATLAFEAASFFDPEAPARPIRIALPIDSTPGGLRKYTKGVALMLSDQLACQKAQLGGMTLGDLVLSVLPWPFHQDLPKGATDCDKGINAGIGLICSLSIPIITICALLLLMIIVNLLDIIFRWVPFFILCFPLPNFKGKKP